MNHESRRLENTLLALNQIGVEGRAIVLEMYPPLPAGTTAYWINKNMHLRKMQCLKATKVCLLVHVVQ